MPKTLLLVPLLAVACSYPRFVASKTVELDVPLAQASKLKCKTHNGSISVTQGPASDSVHVVAVLQARGHTQKEADENLELLSVAHSHDGNALRIYGDYPRLALSNRSPSFSYTMQVPEHLAVSLVSHNGDITTRGTSGATYIETHNGDINAHSANGSTSVETHNGRIDLSLRADQDLEGSAVSHNGDIDIRLEADVPCWLDARTHNGHIKTPSVIHEATISRRSVRCRIGAGSPIGDLKIKTHNGNIAVHDAPAKGSGEPK